MAPEYSIKIMSNSIRLIFTLVLVLFNSVAFAQLGNAPLRIGKPLPDQLELSDTSMVWIAVNFENVSSPSFALGDLSIWYEDSSNAARNDFFGFRPFDQAADGKTSYLVGLALPVGNHKINRISGVSSKILIAGTMWFRVEIPITVPTVGKHYYLGNISIKNIETKNKKFQRSGDPFPLIDQMVSGFGNSTLRITLSDHMESDISHIKRVFPTVAVLQSAVFEKNIISEIKVPYALGQGLDPLTVRATSPRRTGNETALADRDSQVPDQVAQPAAATHSQAVPPETSFASNLDMQHVPQRMSESMKRLYALYQGAKQTKALAISGYGALGMGYGADAMKSAVDNCERLGKPCALYAVDGKVVWDPYLPLAQAAKLEQEKTAASTAKLQPTGFANIDDFEAVPKLGPKGKELYVEWLSKPAPKAVAISDKGAIARGYGNNAVAAAVKTCESFGRPCRIYALNGDVVFEPFPAVHDTPLPMPSNYAEIHNINAPPYATLSQRTQYVSWLEKPIPKTIAINDNGSLFSAYGGDSMVVALENCKKSNRPCKLYAVDSTVVFTPFPAVHSATLPEPTSFASLTDRDALPKASVAGRNNYDQWLQRPKPKAFAISEKGATSYRIGPDSMAESLNGCEKFGSACRLYAVDDLVVFKPFGGP